MLERVDNMKPRTRAVIFRITQDEYNQLKSATERSGARSLSDFARAKCLRAIGEPSTAELSQKVGSLESAVDRLTQVLCTPVRER